MELKAIGVVHSSYKTRNDAPRQGRLSEEIQVLELYPDYIAGIQGMEDLSHIIVLYWQDQSVRTKLISKPPRADHERGVFTTRSPNRPNPIAFTIAEILQVEKNKITVKGVDAIDGSPLLDIKIYSSGIDCVEEAKGWLKDENPPRH